MWGVPCHLAYIWVIPRMLYFPQDERPRGPGLPGVRDGLRCRATAGRMPGLRLTAFGSLQPCRIALEAGPRRAFSPARRALALGRTAARARSGLAPDARGG